MRIIFNENRWLSMVLETKCFYGVEAFEVYLLKVTALKLSHPSACPVFKEFSLFSQLRHSLLGERGRVRGGGDNRGGATIFYVDMV
jgi:hypothetical protein